MKIKSITKIKILLVVLVAMIAGFYLYRYISSNSQRSKATENTDATVNFGDIFRTADHKAVVPTSNIVKDKEYILSFDVLLKNPVQYRISGISFRFRYNPTNITFLPDYTFSEQLDTKVIVDSLRDVDGSGDKIARIVLVNKNLNSVNLPSTVRVMIAFIAKGSGQTKVGFIGSGLRSDSSSMVGVQVSANPVVPYTFALPSESKLFTIVDSTSSSSSSSSSSSTSSSSSSSSSSFVACDLRTTSIACTSIECAWYICSSSCHPRGTTNCEAGCASHCSSSSSSSSFASSSSSSSRFSSSSSSTRSSSSSSIPAIPCECDVAQNCSTTCPYSRYDTVQLPGVIYNNPIRCSLSDTRFISVPTATNRNAWCARSERTKGDTNGDGHVNGVDSADYQNFVMGRKISPNSNPDVNGDGKVSIEDRDIIIKTRSGS